MVQILLFMKDSNFDFFWLINLIKKYIDETNHVRSHVDYSICNENNKPQCLLFNKITNLESKKTIYINGDSWAEGLRIVDLAENIFSKFSKIGY